MGFGVSTNCKFRPTTSLQVRGRTNNTFCRRSGWISFFRTVEVTTWAIFMSFYELGGRFFKVFVHHALKSIHITVCTTLGCEYTFWAWKWPCTSILDKWSFWAHRNFPENTLGIKTPVEGVGHVLFHVHFVVPLESQFCSCVNFARHLVPKHAIVSIYDWQTFTASLPTKCTYFSCEYLLQGLKSMKTNALTVVISTGAVLQNIWLQNLRTFACFYIHCSRLISGA